MNARVWGVWVAAASLPALATHNPLYLVAALLAVAVVRSSLDEEHQERSFPMWRFGVIAVAIATLWNALTAHYGETTLVTLPQWLPLAGGRVTLEATVFGLTSGLAVWLLIAAFNTFSAAVTPYQMLSLAPRMLRHAGLVVSIALTFFPQTLRTAREVREAQAVRGHRPRHWRDLPAIVVPLLLNSLENAAQLAEAMEARGYGRAANRQSGAGWLCLLIGAAVQLYWRESPAGWIAIGAGVAWLVLSERKAGRVTRYRRERWSIRDTLPGLFSLISLGTVILVATFDPATLAYYPYPRVTLPSIDIGVIAAVLALAAPAMRMPGWGTLAGRLHQAIEGLR